MRVLADSLPYQPHTATGYGYSGLAGLLFIGALYWILKSSSSSKSGTFWTIVLVIGALWAFGKSQDDPDTSPPVRHNTVVTTPHKSTPHNPGPSGSSCSLICFKPQN